MCLLLTAQYSDTEYPVQVAGPPLILQGSIPAGAPGGAWSRFLVAGRHRPTKKAAPGKRPGRPAHYARRGNVAKICHRTC